MIALGMLMQAAFGTATVADGLACTQTLVPSMSVNVGPGSIMTNLVVDSSSFGSLAADSVDSLVKMGINIAATAIGPFTAPGTPGQSQNFLIQAQVSETDSNPMVLPYFNAANPASPFSGPANAGTSQNTTRIQRVLLQTKAGAPAVTGSQTTPTPDSGFVGLYQITIANGAVTILNAAISRYSAAPLANEQTGTGTRAGRLINVQPFAASGTYHKTPGTNSVRVTVIGAGGAGGGAAATGASQVSIGGSGQAGAIGIGIITAGFDGQTVTCGTAGAGISGATGNAGTASSFGAFITAPGGSPGTAGAAGTTSNGAGGTSGASASGGSILNARGAPGSNGGGTFSGGLSYNYVGLGGSTLYGGGGTSGAAATGFGAGGGGVSNVQSSGALTGLSGTGGLVMVEEFS